MIYKDMKNNSCRIITGKKDITWSRRQNKIKDKNKGKKKREMRPNKDNLRRLLNKKQMI